MSNAISKISTFVLILAGLNTGLIGLVHFDILNAAMGSGTTALKITELLVGTAALILLCKSFASSSN